MIEESDKYQRQDSLYNFPYHYIPHFSDNGVPSLLRKLSWGLDYLCYQKHLHQKALEIEPNSVLEVGCGDGYFIGGLPAKIPTKVGVDLSEKAIQFAKAFHPECMFYAMDAKYLKEKFDLVCAIEVIEHIPDDEVSLFLKTLKNRVNDNGKVLLTMPTTNIPLNKKHYRHYTLDLFKKQLTQSNTSLEITKVEYIYSIPSWHNIFRKVFNNRLWTFEFKPFMRWAWKQIWRKHRVVNKNNGKHLLVILELSK